MIRRIGSAALPPLAALCATSVTYAQVLGPDFASDYTIESLGFVPGLPSPHGGMTIKDGDPNKLLIIGMAEDALAAIYEIDVTRDSQGHIDGFSGTASLFATAPNADAGLRYGPGGVLFYTTWPTNSLGQIEPGSTVPDKLVDLTPLGVASSTGGLSITPSGFPGAGDLKITSYDGDAWYSADLVADGSGTYDVVGVTFRAGVAPRGPMGILWVDTSYPVFANQSVLINEWYTETVGAYEIDANGDPIPATRRDFFGVDPAGYYPLGSGLDSVTGDFLICDLGSGDQVVVVKTLFGPLGTSYCTPAIPNSTGQSGILSAFGLPTVSGNDVTVTVEQLPPGQFGYFLVGRTQGMFIPPGSTGFLCLTGDIGRYNMLPTVPTGQLIVGPGGSLPIDLADLPTNTPGSQQTLPGETLNFQCWYRDIGPSNNFTDALSITFQ